MANVNVTIGGRLMYGNGNAATSVVVKATRQPDALTDTALNTAVDASATSNSSTGIFSLTVVASDTVATTQKITLSDGRYMYVRIPANAKSTTLGTIIISNTPARGVKDITGQFGPAFWVGQDIASAATIVPTCDYHLVTGTTNITAVTGTNYPAGQILTLRFAAALTFTDGAGLLTAGNLVTTADDVINLRWNGTDWVEIGRSVN